MASAALACCMPLYFPILCSRPSSCSCCTSQPARACTNATLHSPKPHHLSSSSSSSSSLGCCSSSWKQTTKQPTRMRRTAVRSAAAEDAAAAEITGVKSGAAEDAVADAAAAETSISSASSEATAALSSDGDSDAPSSQSSPTAVISSSQVPLISQTSIERILRGDGPAIQVDHYSRLKIPREATNMQISNAFKERVQQVLQQQGIEEELARKQLQIIQESYDILMSDQQRRLYDWSLVQAENRAIRYVWPYEVDITQKLPAPDFAKNEEDDEGTRTLAYFLLGWFLLSIILSVTLKP